MAPFEIDELLHEQGFVAVELEGAEGVDERLVSAPQQRQHAAGTCSDTSVTTIRMHVCVCVCVCVCVISCMCVHPFMYVSGT